MQLAQSVVLLSEEKSKMAAVELMSSASLVSKLNITPQAVQLIWRDVFKKMSPWNSAENSALIAAAGALSSAGHRLTDLSLIYFSALFVKSKGDMEKAISLFSSIETASEYYRLAKLNEGLLFASTGHINRAKDALETVIALEWSRAEKNSDVSYETVIALKEYAALNLARLMFEAKHFKEAIALYRTIDSKSELFYESLSEQGWAFFLAGHPNKALGAEYGASSPFFAQKFQPDLYFLRASVNYWLCDFKAALRDVQSYVIHTKEDAASLRKWTIESANSKEDYQAIIKKSYKLAEELAYGVSAKNSLLGPKTLHSIARQKNLLQKVKALEQFRTLRKEIQQEKWPHATKRLVIQSLLRWEEKEQEQIGRQTLALISNMRSDYERTLLQMRVIHMEIMTAEKDQMLNNGRSAEGQQFMGTEKDFLEAAEKDAHVWTNEKREFWRDELDGFVFRKKSQCNKREGEEINYAEK
jgi:hypothetical protein